MTYTQLYKQAATKPYAKELATLLKKKAGLNYSGTLIFDKDKGSLKNDNLLKFSTPKEVYNVLRDSVKQWLNSPKAQSGYSKMLGGDALRGMHSLMLTKLLRSLREQANLSKKAGFFGEVNNEDVKKATQSSYSTPREVYNGLKEMTKFWLNSPDTKKSYSKMKGGDILRGKHALMMTKLLRSLRNQTKSYELNPNKYW